MTSWHLLSLVHEPAAKEIWIAAFQTDYPGDILKLPLPDTRRYSGFSSYPNERGHYSWITANYLFDADVLCRFVRSRSKLQRIYDSKMLVPNEIYGSKYTHSFSSREAEHVAMRNCWLDMIDIWHLKE